MLACWKVKSDGTCTGGVGGGGRMAVMCISRLKDFLFQDRWRGKLKTWVDLHLLVPYPKYLEQCMEHSRCKTFVTNGIKTEVEGKAMWRID